MVLSAPHTGPQTLHLLCGSCDERPCMSVPGRLLLCPSSPSLRCPRQLAHRHPGSAEPALWATAEERDHLVRALPVGVNTAALAQVLGVRALGVGRGLAWSKRTGKAALRAHVGFGWSFHLFSQREKRAEHLLPPWETRASRFFPKDIPGQRGWLWIQNLF